MIPSAFRILYPSPPVHPPAAVEEPAEQGAPRPGSAEIATEHERLTAGTADLWRQLAALVTP